MHTPPPASEALLAVMVAQGLDDGSEVLAPDDLVELVQRQVDAVVGDAVLREVVGADARCGRRSRSGCAARTLRDAVSLLPLEDPAAQDAHGPVVVLVLAALVLALDLDLSGRPSCTRCGRRSRSC